MLLDAQVLVIADPVIVAEVLHARDFDKVPEMYGGVSQVSVTHAY